MAELAEVNMPAALSGPDIKQEHDLTGPDHLGHTPSPKSADLKRQSPHEDEAQPDSQTKRLKTDQPEHEQVPHDQDNSLENDIELLVKNALSNVDDLVNGLNSSAQESPDDVMELESESPADSAGSPPSFFADPLKHVRNVQTHSLGNLSFTLIYTLIQHQPIEDVLRAIRDPESDHGRAFQLLRQSFESIWKLFTSNDILSAQDVSLATNPNTLLEVSNLTKLCLWLIKDDAESYSLADSNFLTLLNCQVSDLSIDATDLYLGIKTQNCIRQLANKQAEKKTDELIAQTMTEGLDNELKAQHAQDDLKSADHALIALATVRKNELMAETKDGIDTDGLKTKYPPDELIRSFIKCAKTWLASHHVMSIVYGVPIDINVDPVELVTLGDVGDNDNFDLDDLSSFFEKTTSGLVKDTLASLNEAANETRPSIVVDAPDSHAANHLNGTHHINGTNDINGTNGTNDTTGTSRADATESINGTTCTTTVNGSEHPAPARNERKPNYEELEALVSESTSYYVKTTLKTLSPAPFPPTVPTSAAESMGIQLPFFGHLQQQHQAQPPYYAYTQQSAQGQPPQRHVTSVGELPPHQSCPSAELYDKARHAALSKTSAHTRREGLHSSRRPWSQEEEKTLMAGLDMVKGPHWSQILTLFGKEGTISDILRDRTQVQLKDKARNLKLFFLKTNSEMPFYLQAVTGELKTRAPTQAARKEAEERARLNSEEDQASFQGIMALAGGLQHHPQARPRAKNGIGSGVMTPAKAASAAAQAEQGRAELGVLGMSASEAAAMTARGNQGLDASGHQPLQPMPAQNPPRLQNQAQLPPHVPRPHPGQGQQQHEKGEEEKKKKEEPQRQTSENQPAADEQTRQQNPTCAFHVAYSQPCLPALQPAAMNGGHGAAAEALAAEALAASAGETAEAEEEAALIEGLKTVVAGALG